MVIKLKIKEKSSKEVETIENSDTAIQEMYELTQRRFLKQISSLCNKIHLNRPYPRLFFIDLTDDGKLCLKTMCEFDEGWHPALAEDGKPLNLTIENSNFSENIYLKRIMKILKYGNVSSSLKIFHEKNDYLTKLFENDIRAETRLEEEKEFKESYLSIRNLYISKIDPEYSIDQPAEQAISGVQCELKRCELKSGKILWLCKYHQQNCNARILDDYEDNKALS